MRQAFRVQIVELKCDFGEQAAERPKRTATFANLAAIGGYSAESGMIPVHKAKRGKRRCALCERRLKGKGDQFVIEIRRPECDLRTSRCQSSEQVPGNLAKCGECDRMRGGCWDILRGLGNRAADVAREQSVGESQRLEC